MVSHHGWGAGVVAIAIVAAQPCAAQSDLVAPVDPPWTIGKASGGKISGAKDISGIACVTVGANLRRCLIAVDEGFSGVFATIEDRDIRQDGKIRLAPKVDGQEVDAEAAAYDPATRAFYIIGSHGVTRHKCRPNPSSYRIVRIPVDQATGRPTFDYRGKRRGDDWMPPGIATGTGLKAAMLKSAAVGPHVDKCLGATPSRYKSGTYTEEHGANIEGLAVWRDRLFVGFRGPVTDGIAFLMAFDRDAVFGPGEPAATTIPVTLGAGIGVRDLAAVRDGLLILSGPEDDEPARAALHVFDPVSGAVTRLASLPRLSRDGKPEALLVLDETDAAYRVLILSDSVRNGAPTEFLIAKKK